MTSQTYGKQLQMHFENSVSIEVEDNQVVIQPPKYDLEAMLRIVKFTTKGTNIFLGA